MTKLITADTDDDGDDDPHDADDGGEESEHPKQNHGRRSGKIPDVDSCLAALAALAGAVALGYINAARANAIRAMYAEILRHHHKNDSRSDRKGLADADVAELMRKDPKVFSIMEPFLTDDQIDLVMKNAKDGGHGQT